MILILSFIMMGSATEFSGRITGDLYSYQASNRNHLRPYLRFNANLLAWQDKSHCSAGFHTSTRWTTDFGNKFQSAPELFVYDLYAYARNIVAGADIYLGRQFVHSSVGSELVDGGRLRYRYGSLANIEFFGGSKVASEDPGAIQSLSDNLVLGGRSSLRPWRSTRLGLHWMYRERGGDESFNRVGFDGSQRAGRFELYGRVAYNMADFRAAEMLARISWRSNKWYLSGEYLRREPSVRSSSIFTLVDFEQYQILRSEARRTIWRRLSLFGQIEAQLNSEDTPTLSSLGISGRHFSIAWIHQVGSAGESNGAKGSIYIPIRSNINLYGSANLYRYQVQLEQIDHSEAYASSMGCDWQLGSGISTRLEVQYLRNAVSKNDIRLFMRVTKSFSARPSPKVQP